MGAVIEHGTPLVEAPDRVGAVAQLGVDETSWLAANRHHPTLYATGLVDLEGCTLIDMVEGSADVDLRRWCAGQDPGWVGVSPRWPRVWPSPTGPGSARISTTPPAWPTPFMWCASGTRASTSAAASRTRRCPTEAASTTRCTGSAGSCWPGPNASTSEAMTGRCSACASATPTTRWWAPGWPS